MSDLKTINADGLVLAFNVQNVKLWRLANNLVRSIILWL